MVLKYVSNGMRVRVAVAGGTGGLGRAIINGLLGEHHEVFVLTRKVILMPLPLPLPTSRHHCFGRDSHRA